MYLFGPLAKGATESGEMFPPPKNIHSKLVKAKENGNTRGGSKFKIGYINKLLVSINSTLRRKNRKNTK